MNFGVLMQILITGMNTGQKVKILQIQDGNVENGFITISQPRIIQCRYCGKGVVVYFYFYKVEKGE